MDTSIAFKLTNGEDRLLKICEGDEKRAVVLIIHGVAEHIERYVPLAENLKKAGFLAAGFNLAGHGDECPKERLGMFDTKDGWAHILQDVANARELLVKKYPGLPFIMLGHSMGSFILRCYIQKYADALPDMLALCGTGYFGAPILHMGSFVAGVISLFGKKDVPSQTITNMMFPKDKNARTPFDWLTRDDKIVDKYIADPLCGFSLTAGSYKEFFKGLLMLTHEERIKPANPDMPVLFISGEKDPVGKKDGVVKTADKFRKAGYKDVSVKLYAEARHELFNELNRESVTDDFIYWINKHMAEV